MSGSTSGISRCTGRIGEELRAHPERREIAREYMSRWAKTAGRSMHYVNKWREILEMPLEEMIALIGQDTEEMRAMRQATPFAGVSSPAARWAIYRQFPIERHGSSEA
jgi:hypothetical protein